MKSASESKFFSRKYTLNINGRLLDFATPKVMGILNVTQDSFYDGGRFVDESTILIQAEKMIGEGADIIDVGAYSSRPGASDVLPETEMERALFAVKRIRKNFPDVVLSVDTFRSTVAEAAVAEGANLVNDISGGTQDERMFQLVARMKVPYVLMHMRGTPQTMNTMTSYEDVRIDIISWLQQRILELETAGVNDIIVDPGIGFAKTVSQNFSLLAGLGCLHILDKPVMVGVSRKSLIWKTLEISANEALNGTSVLNTLALFKGAAILRVHDVREAVQAIRLMKQL